ncbi:odaE [Enterobacter kobei]|uniref:defense against restriction DarA-related protein n=1 Tax=Enterobacter kobei TaxID=208224 RepID=UPI0021BED1A9|nr:odaE [Enterobacter kobei]UXJ66735.1 odaE [Enterobacter kobei]
MTQSKNNQQYAVLNFEQINEKGLKSLITAINKAGTDVASVESTNKATKKDGIPVKSVTLNLEDQQKVELQVNDTGDVSGFTLNGKKMPLPHAKTVAAMGQIIGRAAEQAAPVFAKSLAKKVASTTRKLTARPKVKSNVQRLADAKKLTDEKQSQFETLRKTIAEEQTRQAGVRSQLEQEKARLESERALTRQLKTQIANLEGELNAQ